MSRDDLTRIFDGGADFERVAAALEQIGAAEIDAIYREWLADVCGERAGEISDRAVAIALAY